VDTGFSRPIYEKSAPSFDYLAKKKTNRNCKSSSQLLIASARGWQPFLPFWQTGALAG
jgi:hypothetical protein